MGKTRTELIHVASVADSPAPAQEMSPRERGQYNARNARNALNALNALNARLSTQRSA